MIETTVLITGGAGYIGSHTVLACREGGYRVVVLDNLVKGRRELLPDDVHVYLGDVGDPLMLGRIFDDHPIAAVLHFAGDIVVPESVAAPLTYYANNTCKTRQLLQLCVERGIARLVFSSTAAVYGEPHRQPVTESAPTQPVNPYGSSKLMVEWMLRDTALAHDFRYVTLRTLVADPGALLAAFDWTPRHDDLNTILRTALDWERRQDAR